jgi:hypothetical protein
MISEPDYLLDSSEAMRRTKMLTADRSWKKILSIEKRVELIL